MHSLAIFVQVSFHANINRLYEKIEAEKSSFRISPGKRVTITLKKWLETKWKELIRAAKK